MFCLIFSYTNLGSDFNHFKIISSTKQVFTLLLAEIICITNLTSAILSFLKLRAIRRLVPLPHSRWFYCILCFNLIEIKYVGIYSVGFTTKLLYIQHKNLKNPQSFGQIHEIFQFISDGFQRKFLAAIASLDSVLSVSELMGDHFCNFYISHISYISHKHLSHLSHT